MATNRTQSQGVEELGEQWSDEEDEAINAFCVWREGMGPVPPPEMWQYYAPKAREMVEAAYEDESQKVA
jgi:hypothetical protein